MDLFSDEYFMQKAFIEAQEAYARGEIPVGAVIVSNQKIIAKAHNLTEMLTDVTAHAEMQAITSASSYLGGKYLNHCALYVTLEPCVMCAGALYWAQIGKVVIGASDPQRGFRANGLSLHPKTVLITDVLSEPCGNLLLDFFRERRK